MRALGFPTLRYKLAAFVLAGTLAGLAGYLAAAKEGYVNPEMLAWHQSGTVLMMLILGGMGTLVGAVLGTFSLRAAAGSGSPTSREHWQLLMGAFIIVAVLVFPQGLAGLAQQLRRRRARLEDASDELRCCCTRTTSAAASAA